MMLKQHPPRRASGSATAAPGTHKPLEARYLELVNGGGFRFDPGQWRALQVMQAFLDGLGQPDGRRGALAWPRFQGGRAADGAGLYLVGDVGLGKSMLMALLFDACPWPAKRKVHCREFMKEAHEFVHRFGRRGGDDALAALAAEIGACCRLLCVDEFEVTDIADAVIFGRLLGRLLDLGVRLVLTSNRRPDELHGGGLLKGQLSPLAGLLAGRLRLVELAPGDDYRLGGPRQALVYHHPLDEHEPAFIASRYQALAGTCAMRPRALEVYGHTLLLSATQGQVALVGFEELCAKPLAAADYLAIADHFSTVIVRGIPRLAAERRNEAKRFVTFIDVAYQRRLRLVCSAQVPPEQIYPEGDGAFEFRRAVSRLSEMQSEQYWRQR